MEARWLVDRKAPSHRGGEDAEDDPRCRLDSPTGERQGPVKDRSISFRDPGPGLAAPSWPPASPQLKSYTYDSLALLTIAYGRFMRRLSSSSSRWLNPRSSGSRITKKRRVAESVTS